MQKQPIQELATNVLLLKTLEEVLSILQAIETPAILLKGAAFSLSLYNFTDNFRAMGDIDILIHEEDLPKVVQALERHGYLIDWGQPFKDESGPAFSSELTATHPEYKVPVDLHWQLLNHLWLRQVILLDYPAIWRRARPATAEGHPTLILSAEDTLLHACSHLAFHHFFSSLKLYKDIGLLVQKENLDWDLFIQTADQSRLKTTAYCTLSLVRSISKSQIPETVLARLRPSALRARLIQVFINPALAQSSASGDRALIKSILIEMLLMDRWRDSAKILVKFLYIGIHNRI